MPELSMIDNVDPTAFLLGWFAGEAIVGQSEAPTNEGVINDDG